MSRYYSVLVITVVVINGLHCTQVYHCSNNQCSVEAAKVNVTQTLNE